MAKLDWNTVDRYFDGTATRQERVRVVWMFVASPAFGKLCRDLYGWAGTVTRKPPAKAVAPRPGQRHLRIIRDDEKNDGA